jgi:hypothetical protein
MARPKSLRGGLNASSETLEPAFEQAARTPAETLRSPAGPAGRGSRPSGDASPRAAFRERIAYRSTSGQPVTRSEAHCGTTRAAHPSGIAPSAPDCRSSGACIANGRYAEAHRGQRRGRGHRLKPAAEPYDTSYRANGWRTRRTDPEDPAAASDLRARSRTVACRRPPPPPGRPPRRQPERRPRRRHPPSDRSVHPGTRSPAEYAISSSPAAAAEGQADAS